MDNQMNQAQGQVAGKGRFFYGWVNVGALWINYLALMGGLTYVYGVTVSHIAKDLNMSMAVAMGAYTCYMLIQGLSAPIVGRVMQRIGPKKCMLIGSATGVAASALMVFVVRGTILYYITWALLFSVMMSFGMVVPSQVIISNWFFNKRGSAMVAYMTAGGFGGLLFAPLASKVIAMSGSWRSAWVVMLVSTAIAFVIVSLLIRERPEDMGTVVDGAAAKNAGGTGKVAKPCTFKTKDPWLRRDVLRSPAYYIIVLSHIAAGFVLTCMTNQSIGHLTQRGISPQEAAAVLGFFSFSSLGGRFLSSFLADRIDPRRTSGIGAIVLVLGLFLLRMVSSTWQAYLAAAIIGICFGICYTSSPNIVANYYGTHDYRKIVIAFTMMTTPFTAFSAIIAGLIFDATGSYQMLWTILIIMLAVVAVLLNLIKQPKYGDMQAKNDTPQESN